PAGRLVGMQDGWSDSRLAVWTASRHAPCHARPPDAHTDGRPEGFHGERQPKHRLGETSDTSFSWLCFGMSDLGDAARPPRRIETRAPDCGWKGLAHRGDRPGPAWRRGRASLLPLRPAPRRR